MRVKDTPRLTERVQMLDVELALRSMTSQKKRKENDDLLSYLQFSLSLSLCLRLAFLFASLFFSLFFSLFSRNLKETTTEKY
jgi:hypothetical protein